MREQYDDAASTGRRQSHDESNHPNAAIFHQQSGSCRTYSPRCTLFRLPNVVSPALCVSLCLALGAASFVLPLPVARFSNLFSSSAFNLKRFAIRFSHTYMARWPTRGAREAAVSEKTLSNRRCQAAKRRPRQSHGNNLGFFAGFESYLLYEASA